MQTRRIGAMDSISSGFTAEEMYYKPNQLSELSSEIPIAQSSSDDHKSPLTLVSIIEILRNSFPVIWLCVMQTYKAWNSAFLYTLIPSGWSLDWLFKHRSRHTEVSHWTIKEISRAELLVRAEEVIKWKNRDMGEKSMHHVLLLWNDEDRM